MSKYVRTENIIYKMTDDLIIKDDKLYEKEFGSNYFDNEEIYLRDVFLGKVIKEADTIEELCDGFYIDVLGDGLFNFDGLYIYNDFDKFKEDYISYYIHDDVENAYGFIKTDSGLMYVAKMNSEKELELI